MLLIVLICAYLLGSFPTGTIVSRFHGIDIAAHGSGNVGATNIARTLGKKSGLLTLSVDCAKGALAVLLASFVGETAAAVATAAVVSGHCFSIPTVWKGGKGVATGLGALAGISPASAGVALIIFLTTFAKTKVVALASISAAICAPIIVILLDRPHVQFLGVGYIALLITLRHHSNIRRLIEGREPTFKTI